MTAQLLRHPPVPCPFRLSGFALYALSDLLLPAAPLLLILCTQPVKRCCYTGLEVALCGSRDCGNSAKNGRNQRWNWEERGKGNNRVQS